MGIFKGMGNEERSELSTNHSSNKVVLMQCKDKLMLQNQLVSNMSLSRLQQIVKDREACSPAWHGQQVSTHLGDPGLPILFPETQETVRSSAQFLSSSFPSHGLDKCSKGRKSTQKAGLPLCNSLSGSLILKWFSPLLVANAINQLF